jgi:type II secretory pathway component PulJ
MMQTRNPRHAFTLVEAIVVLCLSVLLLVAVYEFQHTVQSQSTDLELRLSTYTDAQNLLTLLTKEICTARRILYPAPGGADTSGLSVISAEGAAVLYAFEAGSPGTLVKTDVATKRRAVVIPRLARVQFKVPPVPPGRDADLVHVTLTFPGPRGHSFYLMTSCRLRALDIRCPLDRPR